LLLLKLRCKQSLEIIIEAGSNLIMSGKGLALIISQVYNYVSSCSLQDGLLKEMCVSIPLQSPQFLESLFMELYLLSKILW